MKKDVAIRRFILQTPHKFEVAEREPRLSAVFLQLDPETGKALKIETISLPEFVREAAVVDPPVAAPL
jgi:calcineurin-like phosphoesterase